MVHSRIVIESGPALALDESRVRQELEQEWNVGLDTTDTELNKRTEHLSARDLIRCSTDSALDEQRVVVRCNLCTCKAGGGIETDTVTTCTTVNFDFTGIGLEVLCRVLSRDTALDGEATLGDCLLREAKLGKCGASCDLNLGGDDVDAGDFLCVGEVEWRGFVSWLNKFGKLGRTNQ